MDASTSNSWMRLHLAHGCVYIWVTEIRGGQATHFEYIIVLTFAILFHLLTLHLSTHLSTSSINLQFYHERLRIVPFLLGATFLGALARPSTIVHVQSEPSLLEQDITPCEKRKFNKLDFQQSNLTRLAGSIFSSPYEPVIIAENSDIVTTRLEFTGSDYAPSFCGNTQFRPLCCYVHFITPHCFDRMLILYSGYCILEYSHILLAKRPDLNKSKEGLTRLCKATTLDGHHTELQCCGGPLNVNHY